MEQYIKKYSLLDRFHVSRETYLDFEKFILQILEKNSEINLISKESEENIRFRHIIDCAQIIDFIDLNDNMCCDLGSGAGMPGIVIAIMMKNLNQSMKFNLYEKSYHKSLFLKDVSRKLNLNTEVIQKDIFKLSNLSSDTIMARSFKPLPVVLEFVYNNFNNYKNLIMFMGKTGKQTLNEGIKKWDFEYKEKKSLTSENSFLLNIRNIKKKN